MCIDVISSHVLKLKENFEINLRHLILNFNINKNYIITFVTATKKGIKVNTHTNYKAYVVISYYIIIKVEKIFSVIYM